MKILYYRLNKISDLSLDLNMAQAITNIQRWNCSIYIPIFGIQAMTGPITLIANGRSYNLCYGIQFKHIPPYISLHVFHLHMFSPRSAATISLANAVVVIGGHSDGARVSTIGKLKKIFHMNMELL